MLEIVIWIFDIFNNNFEGGVVGYNLNNISPSNTFLIML